MSLHVQTVRNHIVENEHELAFVLVDEHGGFRASQGDVHRLTLARSAAKPFQAVPLFEQGVDRFGITDEDVALACASHSSERFQVEKVIDFLHRVGAAEETLVCGPHRPLGRDLAYPHADGTRPDLDFWPRSSVASNCSGKHAGLIATALASDLDPRTYHVAGGAIQERCRRAVASACGVGVDDVLGATDGCGVVCWAVPLYALAVGYARLGMGVTEPLRRIRDAMMTHANLVGGTRRLCTELMTAFPGHVLAKVGADGVYAAAFPELRLGLALKVFDGNSLASGVALLAVIQSLKLLPELPPALSDFVAPSFFNTRGHAVGVMQAIGAAHPITVGGPRDA